MTRNKIGKILGFIVISFWVFILLGHIFGAANEHLQFTETAIMEGVILTLLIFTEIVGFLLNFKYKRLGATIVIIGALFLCVFAGITAGHNKLLAISVSGLPFLIVGILIF
ncbi:hypothetical protein [Thermosipho atlanticus]|uniref:DoxX-like family protein n=1 Tax=Thermosipho atlanticus DSM 15807 TaxID=1123380 RepID=A0A1M5U5U8_9BACT|nr:hypothetical protein [Thermosipho atlanticus]SHH58445.1 hypothetical protein SAMN02745199_1644 [Thermosipho atlanticus DSM 15807]